MTTSNCCFNIINVKTTITEGAYVVIYTVTLNPAIDKTVEIPDFTAGKVNRIQSLRIDAGGKGINVTKCLANLGMESMLM